MWGVARAGWRLTLYCAWARRSIGGGSAGAATVRRAPARPLEPPMHTGACTGAFLLVTFTT